MVVCSDMTLLTRFFGGENGLNLSSEKANVQEYVEQEAKRIDKREPILYLTAYYQKHLHYYVMCDDPLLLSQLSLWLTSALGTARNSAVRIQKCSDVGYEQILYERYPHGVLYITQFSPEQVTYRLNVNANADTQQLLQCDKAFIHHHIESTLLRYGKRPNLDNCRKRPLGRILRDFYLACDLKENQLAQNLYKEICPQGVLDRRNMITLEFQVHAVSEQWHRIVSHPDLELMVRGVISKRVTELVLKAYAKEHEINIDEFSKINWLTLKENLIDLQDFFLRKPNLNQQEGSKVYWQYWAIFACALNGDFLAYLPANIVEQWGKQLKIPFLTGNEMPKNRSSIAESPIEHLLAMPKTEEGAMKVIEYTSKCFEHELFDLLAWLFSLPSDIQVSLKQNVLILKRWQELEIRYYQLKTEIVTSGHLTEEKWSEWFTKPTRQLEISYEYFRCWCVDDINFKAISASVLTTNHSEHVLNSLPYFFRWIEENRLNGISELWLNISKLIVNNIDLSWSDYEFLKRSINYFHNTPYTSEQLLELKHILNNSKVGDLKGNI